MRFWGSVSSAALLLGGVIAGFGSVSAQAQKSGRAQGESSKPGMRRKFNELTLAGLRPGRDKAAKALQLFGKPDSRSEDQQSLVWSFEGEAGMYSLHLDVDKANVVQFIRVSLGDGPSGVNLPKHAALNPRTWASGHGLAAGAAATEVTRLYGEPDSRSPSTKGGQQLELLYYAFDWAGADVPQVMEVVCSLPQDGKPGRVVEITLAAPSL
jgi:hypothetical protein